MQKVIEIEINNIQLHLDTKFKLDDGKCITISGKNKDNPKMEVNGAGKSTLLEPLYVCFLGASARGCSLKKLITRGKQSGFAKVTLRDSDDKETVIKVDIHKGSSTKVSIWEDGNFRGDLHDLKSTVSFQYIQTDILGVSKQDLLDFFLISSESKGTFLSSTNSQKQKVISRFSESDKVDSWIIEVKENIKELREEEVRVERGIVSVKAKTEAYKDSISNIKLNCPKEIEDSTGKLKMANKYISDLEIKETGHLEDIRKANILIEDEKSAILEITNVNYEYKEELSKLNSEIRDLASNVSRGEDVLKKHHTCPKCSTKFTEKNKDLDLGEVQKYIVGAGIKIADIGKKVNKVKSLISVNETKIKSSSLDNLKRQVRAVETDIRDINTQLRSAHDRKQILQNSSSLQKTRKIDADREMERYRKLIEENNAKVNILEADALFIEDKITNCKFWVSEFFSFKMYLNQNTVKLIESKINKVLSRISDHEVIIKDTKQTATGDTKSEVNVLIDGNTYSEYSGGEKGRIDVASFVAFRELINAKSEKGLNFLCLDEALDRVDRLGIYSITDSLNNLGVTSLLVSQVQTTNENAINVERKNNVSKIT